MWVLLKITEVSGAGDCVTGGRLSPEELFNSVTPVPVLSAISEMSWECISGPQQNLMSTQLVATSLSPGGLNAQVRSSRDTAPFGGRKQSCG